MKLQELKEKTNNELETILAESYERLRTFRFDIATKQIKNNQEYRNTRRLIARIRTLLTERSANGQAN